MGLFRRSKEHPMHKQLKDYKRKKLEREIEKAEEEAYHKARIKRAKQVGRARGMKGKPSITSKLGGAMDSIEELMVGKDFTFGPVVSDKKKKKKDYWDLI